MSNASLYPLRFEPIYQYRLWGGRRLAELLSAPLPGDGPIGEAWVLSDRDDHQSLVANGPLKGQMIGRLMQQFREQLMGKFAPSFRRFPLLLKFLDAREMLSVQVHPSDAFPDLIPPGETSKTEAWVVIEAGKESQIYAGLKPGTTAGELRQVHSPARQSRTTLFASLRSPATLYLFPPERFTLWAVVLLSSRFSKTATSHSAFTTGVI
jgi:mannose-6-phosphate isomerase